MRIVYHALGGIAKLDATLARYRFNFIPANLILLAVLAYWVFSLGSNAVDALTNAPTPMAVSLAHLDDSGAVRQHYIRLAGDLMPSVIYRHENDSRTDWWSPLIDRASGRAILVKRSGNVDSRALPGVEVTGMLRTLTADARNRLAEERDQYEGVAVENRYELEADEKPGDPAASVAVAALVALVFLAWCIVLLRQRAIFQTAASAVPPPVYGLRQGILVRTTGRFTFDAKNVRRFADIHAVLSVDNGTLVLQSKIDTTHRFMGVGSRRVGIWTIAVRPGSVSQCRFGYSYFGMARRHALRFAYVDAFDGRVRQAILGADNPQDVAMAAAIMGAPMSSAAMVG